MNFIYMLNGNSVFFSVMEKMNIVMLCIILLLYMSQNISAIVGLVTKARKYPDAKKNHKYAILIAARNEEKVIGNLIDSIKQQDYPSELIDIFVVADNCDDNTYEVAIKHGAIAYKRNDDNLKGKSYALKYLIEKIEENHNDAQHEAYFIFDADNLLSKTYIKEMNKAYDSGVKICTSFRDTKNFDDSWVSANSAMMFYRECSLVHHTRTLFNVGTYVSGTGYFIDTQIIKDNGGWIHHLMIEDIELSIDSAIKGYKVMYCEDAIFYDEQPINLKDSFNQRLRWCKGTHQCFGKYEGKLLWKGFKKNALTCLELAIHVCPAPIIGLGWTIIYSIISFIEGIVINDSVLVGLENIFSKGFLIVTVMALCVLFYSLAVVIKDYKRMKAPWYKKVLYCFTFPFYMAVFLITSCISLFKKVSWKAVPHTRDKTIQEVTGN